MTLALCAETRAYWWHQSTPPPLSSAIAAGTFREFVAVVAMDKDPGVVGFRVRLRYMVDGREVVEERMEPALPNKAFGATVSAVFEVRGARQVTVVVQALTGGETVTANGADNAAY